MTNNSPIPENEPDFAMFFKEDMMYAITRHPFLKFLCGYIILPKDHPLEKDINYYDYNVYGGVTYNEMAFPNLNDFFEFKDVRVIGFDCCHLDDWTYDIMEDIPGGKEHMEKVREELGFDIKTENVTIHVPYSRKDFLTYRDMDFLLKELDKLADQIRERVKFLEKK